MRGKKWRLQYKGLQDLCFTCRKYDHHEVRCPLKPPNENGESTKANEMPTDDEHAPESSKQEEGRSSSFGPWMVVQRNKRRPMANPKGILGSMGERTAGDADAQARSMEGRSIVNSIE